MRKIETRGITYYECEETDQDQTPGIGWVKLQYIQVYNVVNSYLADHYIKSVWVRSRADLLELVNYWNYVANLEGKSLHNRDRAARWVYFIQDY